MLSYFVALAHATAESAWTIARGSRYISMVISMILSAMKYKRVVDCLKWSCPAGATWKNLQRMAVLTLSLSRYHPPSLLPVLPLVNMPVHSNSFEIRPNCIQTLWSFEFIVIGVVGLWRRLQFTDSKLLTLVSQKTLVMCIHQRKWTAPWGCLARHGLPLVSASARHRYLLMSEMQWTVTRLFPAALAFPCCIWSSVQRSWAKLCGLWPSCGEKLKLDIQIVHIYTMHIYIYIICRNKLKTTTNHKTQVPATRYFLSHTQRSIRGETTIHRLLVCNNTPRAV